MIYYGTTQWHWIRDAAAYHQALHHDHAAGVLGGHRWRVSRRLRFVEDRRRFGDLVVLSHYQRVWDGRSPEWQADFYAAATDPLPAN